MRFKSLILLGLIITLCACASVPQVPMQMRIDAATHLNQNPSGASLPVRLKLYQLNDATRFHEATFRQLWKSDARILGSSLLEKKELTINPGDVRKLKMNRNKDAVYIAVIGVFRHVDDTDWKAVKLIPGSINTLVKTIVVSVKNNTVEIK